jgi:Precorrin-6B methylase 2
MSITQSLFSIVEKVLPLRKLRTTISTIYDNLNGLDTNSNVLLEDLGLADKGRCHYAPSSWMTVHRIAKMIPFTTDDVFVDFGSGKGRQIVLAARYFSFKRVIGVELSEALNDIARSNVERNRKRLKCTNIEIVTTDVLEYEIPLDMTIAYFYSPFTGDLFRSVIDRIESTLAHRPDSPLWIVLQRPVYGMNDESLALYQGPEDMLRSTPWLHYEKSMKFKSRHWATEISVYKSLSKK